MASARRARTGRGRRELVDHRAALAGREVACRARTFPCARSRRDCAPPGVSDAERERAGAGVGDRDRLRRAAAAEVDAAECKRRRARASAPAPAFRTTPVPADATVALPPLRRDRRASRCARRCGRRELNVIGAALPGGRGGADRTGSGRAGIRGARRCRRLRTCVSVSVPPPLLVIVSGLRRAGRADADVAEVEAGRCQRQHRRRRRRVSANL